MVSFVLVRGDVHSREKSAKYCTITCYPRFVAAVAHVRYDKLLPRHQEPRHRMYFYAGDVPQISSCNESVQKYFFARYLRMELSFGVTWRFLCIVQVSLDILTCVKLIYSKIYIKFMCISEKEILARKVNDKTYDDCDINFLLKI